MLLTIFRTLVVAPSAPCIPPNHGETGIRFICLRRIEKMRPHLRDRVIGHIQESKSTACYSWIKPKNIIWLLAILIYHFMSSHSEDAYVSSKV